MADFTGIIVEESLENEAVLSKVKIVSTEVEDVTPEHKTPWIKTWTMHTVSIKESEAQKIAEEISKSLDRDHEWYADFKNDKFHIIIFRAKVFKVDRSKPDQYAKVTKYGVSVGIPEYQLDFSPHIKEWQR